MIKICRKCNEELPDNYITDICLKCSKENVRKIFKENPELEQAFKESIEEMKKPENIKTMVDNTIKFLNTVKLIKN